MYKKTSNTLKYSNAQLEHLLDGGKKTKTKKKAKTKHNLRRCNWASSLRNNCAINIVVNTRLDTSCHRPSAGSHVSKYILAIRRNHYLCLSEDL